MTDPPFQEAARSSSHVSNSNRGSSRRARTARRFFEFLKNFKIIIIRPIVEPPSELEVEETPVTLPEVAPSPPPKVEIEEPVVQEEEEGEEPVIEPVEHVEHAENEPTYCICSQVSFGEMIGNYFRFIQLT